MRLVLLIVIATFLVSSPGMAQDARDFLVGGSFDLIKSDNDGFVQKGQIGAEGHYFITHNFAASAGAEIWTDDGPVFLFGARFYPIQEFFIRMRALVGENDLSIGAGWNKPVTENWHFEAMGDFYFEGEFAIRIGLMYLIRHR